MPIDFKQVAAPSFSDSNTLVALAAKQQQEAMTGIQGAWTGAMDAVGNRVQGEMEGIANQASFSQLTDPTQRAALDQQIMAANVLGMGDVKEINKYTDARRGVQLGLIDNVNRVDSAAQIESERAQDKQISDASRYLADVYTQADGIEDEDKKKAFLSQGQNYLDKLGLSQAGMSMAAQGADEYMQKRRIAGYEEAVKALGPNATQAQIDAVIQNTDASKVNVALAVSKDANQGKRSTLASKRKYADSLGLQGVFSDEGEVQYNVLMQKAVDTVARSAQEQERVDPDNMSYDQYLLNSTDLIDKKLGTFGRSTSTKGLQNHFRWADENGAGYSERDKILITEGLLTGSIKMNLFTDNFVDNFRDNQEQLRIGEAIGNTYLPKVETEFNTKRMQAGQDAFGPIVDFLRSENIPPDEGLRKLGITSLDHPQAKYLPENYKKALELLITNDKAAYMAEVPSGTSVGKTRDQLAKEGVKSPDLDIAKLVGKGSPGSGVLANKTTEDLAAIGKANNVGTASPATNPKTTNTDTNQASKPTGTTAASKPKPVSKTTDNGYVIPNNAPTITAREGSKQYEYLPITTSVAKKLGLNVNSKGDIVMPPNRKNEVVYDVYGGKWTLKDAETYKEFTGINNSGQAKDKVAKGNAFIKGTSKYKPPTIRLKTPDLKHPLAHKLSDDPNNFVPYNERNPDGSPKHISKVEKKKYGKFTYNDAYTKY